MDKVKGR